MNGPMNASAASQKTRRKLHKKLFERIKESKWGKSKGGKSCKYM